MEPDFFSQFEDILVRYRSGNVDFTDAKKDLLGLFERHSDDPRGKEIGFDLSHVDPSIKLIVSEALARIIHEVGKQKRPLRGTKQL